MFVPKDGHGPAGDPVGRVRSAVGPTLNAPVLPDPCVVVLVGASGAGKSTWAASRFRRGEIASSDGLRAMVGTSEYDLDASADAFAILDAVVSARLTRGLGVVIDTLGLEVARRRGYLAAARAAGLPAVVVLFATESRLCRARNQARDRPVPAKVLDAQLRRMRDVATEVASEGWDEVVTVEETAEVRPVESAAPAPPTRTGFVLQLSRFPWGADPVGWLTAVARACREAGFEGIALMDHLIQIPQVGRAWDPIPEPYVTLGLLAGLGLDLRLGALVSPVSIRAPGVLAKTVATLDALSGGRAFCGMGAGWFAREHAGFGLAFPPPRQRLDQLEDAIGTVRMLCGPGTKPYKELPETTNYPRPTGRLPIIVGGAGDRTLSIAARLGDAANIATAALEERLPIFRAHCVAAGRTPELTVLDLPLVGEHPDHLAALIERHRGRTSARDFARRHHAATSGQHALRLRVLADQGVRTVFVGLPDLSGPDEVERFGRVIAQA